MEALERHLRGGGFAVLTFNSHDPSLHGPYEAWGYQGPLDFNAAGPRTFGVGDNTADALEALDAQLQTDEVSASGQRQADPSPSPQLLVIIAVSGGVADVLAKSKGIIVRIYDYDVDGSSEVNVSRDPLGRPCCISEWPAQEQTSETNANR